MDNYKKSYSIKTNKHSWELENAYGFPREISTSEYIWVGILKSILFQGCEVKEFFYIHLDLLNFFMLHIFTKSKEFKKILLKQGLTFKCDHLTVLVYRSGTNFHLLPSWMVLRFFLLPELIMNDAWDSWYLAWKTKAAAFNPTFSLIQSNLVVTGVLGIRELWKYSG